MTQSPDFFEATNRGVAPSAPGQGASKPAAIAAKTSAAEEFNDWAQAQRQKTREAFVRFVSAPQPNVYDMTNSLGASPAAQLINQADSGLAKAGELGLNGAKAVAETGGQIATVMRTIEDSSRAAAQSLADYRQGVGTVGQTMEGFARQIPLIGSSLKAGESVGGLIGYALFGAKTADMIQGDMEKLDQQMKNMINAKTTSQNVIQAEEDRVEQLRYEADRRKIDPNDAKKLEEFDNEYHYKQEIKSMDRRLHEGKKAIDEAARSETQNLQQQINSNLAEEERAEYIARFDRALKASQDAKDRPTAEINMEKTLVAAQYHHSNASSRVVKTQVLRQPAPTTIPSPAPPQTTNNLNPIPAPPGTPSPNPLFSPVSSDRDTLQSPLSPFERAPQVAFSPSMFRIPVTDMSWLFSSLPSSAPPTQFQALVSEQQKTNSLLERFLSKPGTQHAPWS